MLSLNIADLVSWQQKKPLRTQKKRGNGNRGDQFRLCPEKPDNSVFKI
jgi:hypothetical protein